MSNEMVLPNVGDVLRLQGRLLLVSNFDHSTIREIAHCSLAEAFDLAPGPHHEPHPPHDGRVVFAPDERQSWSEDESGWFWYDDDLAVHFYDGEEGPDAVFYLGHNEEEMLCIDRSGALGTWSPAD